MDNEKEIKENSNTDIFEEFDSGLEEQEKDEEIARENDIPLPIGDALNDEELYQLSSKKDIDLICMLGPVACGKTTFGAMLYSMFLRQINNDILFAGSQTIVGFETLLNYIRVYSGKSKVDMPRTPEKNRRMFYHLELLEKSLSKKQDIIFADVSGELFKICKANKDNLDREIPFLSIAKNIAIFIDGEKLLDNFLRHSAILDAQSILRTIRSSKQFRNGMNIDIIISKNDKVAERKNDVRTMAIIENIEQQFKVFNNDFNIKIFRIQALNDYCSEIDDSSTSLIDLLKYWLLEKKCINDVQGTLYSSIQVKSCFNRFMERRL